MPRERRVTAVSRVAAAVGRRGSSCVTCAWDSEPFCLATDRNWRTTSKAFQYYRCPRCGTVFRESSDEDLSAFYPRRYYEMPVGLTELRREAEREQYKVELVRRHVSGGNLLDVGGGYGRFAAIAQAEGFKVSVIEADSASREYLRRTLEVSAFDEEGLGEAIKREGPFDAITFWHSIEHIPEFVAALDCAASGLAEGGAVVVATPNPASLQLRIFGGTWAHLDCPRHLQLIPVGALIAAVEERTRLRLAEITSTDEGSRAYDDLGWRWSFRNAVPFRGASRLGRAVGLAARLWERRRMKGTCYTAVFVDRSEGCEWGASRVGTADDVEAR